MLLGTCKYKNSFVTKEYLCIALDGLPGDVMLTCKQEGCKQGEVYARPQMQPYVGAIMLCGLQFVLGIERNIGFFLVSFIEDNIVYQCLINICYMFSIKVLVSCLCTLNLFVGLYLSWFLLNGVFHEPIMAVGNIKDWIVVVCVGKKGVWLLQLICQ